MLEPLILMPGLCICGAAVGTKIAAPSTIEISATINGLGIS